MFVKYFIIFRGDEFSSLIYEPPRLACGPLEGRVSLAEETVEVLVNAPTEAAKAAFFFLEEILGIIDQVAAVSFHNLQ